MALVALLGLVAAACDWNQFGTYAAHTRSTYDTAIDLVDVGDVAEVWSIPTAGAIDSSPAVVGGRVYVGSTDGTLYVQDARTGAPEWSAATGGAISSSPAVHQGSVFIGSDDNTLRAYDAVSGAPGWSTTVDASFGGISSAPMANSGAVYAASGLGVYAYDAATGTPNWTRPLTSSDPLSVPAKSGGLVYVASYADATVWALRASTGTVAWTTTIAGPRASCDPAMSSPAIADGTLYVALCPAAATPTDSVFALDATTGAVQWASGSHMHATSPAVTDGRLFVGSAAGQTLEALDVTNGSTLWEAPIGAAVRSSAAIAAGVVYVGADDGDIRAFDAAGVSNCTAGPVVCSPVWSATTGGPIRSSPAVSGETIYVGSDDNELRAFALPTIGFDRSSLQGASLTNPTVADWGPDGRLYVAQADGLIIAHTITRNAPNDYSVTATETISLVQQIPNHDDDGTPNPAVTERLITGILATGTATEPGLFVASSDPRVGGGPGGVQTGVDTNSSMISLVSRVGGNWQRQDVVRGLPRSEENHATNAIVHDTVNDILYVGQGGHTNMGAVSTNFNLVPEYALSAAVLSIDLGAIGGSTYDIPTLVDEDNPTNTTPFGGNGGKHQAIISPGGPVQVHAPGFRNPFALVLTQAGNLFVIDNGPNGGWGDIPVNEGPAGNCTNDQNEPGVGIDDTVHLVTGPGYYGGHPNPTRGNMANTFNVTNPQSPVPSANPIECDFLDPASNGSLLTLESGTTGAEEYTADNLGNQLAGDIFVANIKGWVHRLELDPTGTSIVDDEIIFSGVGLAPVDLAIQGPGDPHPGTVWVPDYATGVVTVLEPIDFDGIPPPPCGGSYSAALDEDNDGYTNADEIDAGTNPCSAADTPNDWDGDLVSDVNDPDDDDDGTIDVSDPFPIDPDDGLTTSLPIAYSFDTGATNQPCAPTPTPSGCPGGLLGLGFTGLMSNGTTDYNAQFDENNMVAGGAAGVLTVASVPAGDALGGANTQEYAFHYGVDTDPVSTGVFTVRTQIAAPFSGVTPTGQESAGVSIGTGSQDDYAKLVVSYNGGSPEVQLVVEIAGTPTVVASVPMLTALDTLDLYLTVDPSASTVQARFVPTIAGVRGSFVDVGGPTAIPASWLASTTSGLAIGVIATSTGGAPFPVTWTLLEATLGPPGSWASLADASVQRGEVSFVYSSATGDFFLSGGHSTVHERYDPVTDTWSTVAPLPASIDHSAAVEVGGLIYHVGGLSGWPSPAVGTVHVYDPVTDQFTLGTPMPVGRERGAGGVAVRNGLIYYAGGLNNGVAVPWFDVYDPVAGTWTALPDMPEARDHFAGVVAGDRFHAIGGRDRFIDATTPNHDVYDFVTGQWVTGGLAPLPTPRGGFGAALIGDEIFVIGGEGGGFAYNTVEAYDIVADTWTTYTPMPTARHGIQAAECDGLIYVAAGHEVQGGLGKSDVTEVFAPATPGTCGVP